MTFPTYCPYCTGRDGRPKRLYADRQEAKATAEYERINRRVRLRAYPCEHRTGGWHLTSTR
jgi:hypothetical protein